MPPVAKMGQVDFSLLRRLIAEASRQSFDAVRMENPDEEFYAFALYTVDDAVGINPSANSEREYQLIKAREMSDEKRKAWLRSHGISFHQSLLGDQRWNAFEWKYYSGVSGTFQQTYRLIDNGGVAPYDHDDPVRFVKFKAGVLASMVLALDDLNRDGYFGTGAARESPTVFASVPNSTCTTWLEEDSSRRLNPPKVFQIFAAERLKWILSGVDRRDIEHDVVRAAYLSYVQRGRLE